MTKLQALVAALRRAQETHEQHVVQLEERGKVPLLSDLLHYACGIACVMLGNTMKYKFSRMPLHVCCCCKHTLHVRCMCTLRLFCCC